MAANTLNFFNDKNSLEFITLLIDTSSEVIREDLKLKQLGLMQLSYSSTYEYLNKYNSIINDATIINNSINIDNYLYRYNNNLSITEIKSIKKKLRDLKDDMRVELSKVTNYIGLINYIIDEFSFKNNRLVLNKLEKLEGGDKLNLKTINFENLKNDLKSLIARLSASIDAKDTSIKNDLNILNNILIYIKKAENLANNDIKNETISDVIFTLNSEFIPLLTKQSYRGIEYLNIIENINILNTSFSKKLFNNTNIKINTQEINTFLVLVSQLYDFDKSSTINEYLKLIEDVGDIFPNDNIKNSLKTITTFIKDYTIIDENNDGEKIIEFNIESFISKLDNIKPYEFNRFEFLFTVGMNTAYFTNDLSINDSTSVGNLNYVSEKIGLKIKIWDNSFWMNRNPGETYKYNGSIYKKLGAPTEPLVSNYHLLFYTSGLLYNLVNVKSNTEFNQPLVGAGLGLTFFNSLDFNLSYGVPVNKEPFETPFINIGFDIQFIEYYNRLQSKRKASNIQKKLTKALSE